MSDEMKHIDDAFASGFDAFEAETFHADWEKMEVLLDNDTAVPVVPPVSETTFRNRKIRFSIMITLIISTIMALLFGVNEKITKENNPPKANEVEEIILTSQEAKEEREAAPFMEKMQEDGFTKNIERSPQFGSANRFVLKNNLSGVSFLSGTSEPRIEKALSLGTSPSLRFVEEKAPLKIDPPKDSAKRAELSDLIAKTFVKKVWVEPEYEYVYKDHEGDIDQGWFGIHYTREEAVFNDSNSNPLTHGFNLQFMSGNAFKQSPIAVYGGFDWGMQFRGRSDKTEVVLNTANDDLGYTLLSSMSHDFLLRAHAEYPKFRLVPYVTAFAGPRFYFTGQKVAMYNPPVDVEGSSRETLEAPATLLYGVGAGVRLKITDAVSFDARWEAAYSNQVEVVDLQNSNLVGTSYNLQKRIQNGDFNQIKLGFVFDLSERESERELIKEGYYEEVEQTYFIDPNDANRMIIPCDCPCDEKKRQDEDVDDNEPKRWYDYILDDAGNGGNNWGGGSSGGRSGGGSVPSIKGPVINH